MKLKDWIGDKDLSENEQKKLSRLMNAEVVFEFICHNEASWFSWQNFGTQKYVFNWVILVSGHVVAWNENPSKGWSFPSKKIPTDMYVKCINKVSENRRRHKEQEKFLSALEQFKDDDIKNSIGFEGEDFTIKEIIAEVKNDTELGERIRLAVIKKTIELLK